MNSPLDKIGNTSIFSSRSHDDSN